MNVHKSASFEHKRMNAVTTIEQARELALSLERRERSRTGKLETARAALANRIGVAPATWKNLSLGRLKRLDAWMRDRLQALVIRELEAEIARLQHELETARRCGAHLASEQVGEIETHLARVRALLNGTAA